MPYSRAMGLPYPSRFVRDLQLRDGTRIRIRPIREDDREIEKEFVRSLSAESRYFRFMSAMGELPEPMLTRFTRIDYDREMALIAVVCENDMEREIGVARYVVDANGAGCEFAIAIADAWQRRGIGTLLMKDLERVAVERGLHWMEGVVLAGNMGMLELAGSLGFTVETKPGDYAVRHVRKALQAGQVLPRAAPSAHVN